MTDGYEERLARRTCPGVSRECGAEPLPGDRYCGGCRAEFDNMPDDPEYGGAFDGFTVTSDADPGL